MDWPEVIVCERNSCGKRINTKNDQFSIVDIEGNVVKRKQDEKKKFVRNRFVVCTGCSKKVESIFKRRNVGMNLEKE
jgi:hypothetical protein